MRSTGTVWAVFSGIIAAGFAGGALADTKLVMDELMVVSAAGGAAPVETRSTVTLWLASDRAARIDSAGRAILRLDRGEFYIVNEASKSVRVTPFASLPVGDLRIQGAKKTGKSRKVGSWQADHYELSVDLGMDEAGRMDLWVSDEVDIDMDVYRAFMRGVDQGQSLTSSIAALPGYPVLHETNLGIVRSRVELLEVSDGPPPPGTYEPPEGYARQ